MKLLKIFTIICALFLFSHVSADEETQLSAVDKTVVKEFTIESLDFDNLKATHSDSENALANLSDLLQEADHEQTAFRSYILRPISEGFAYVNGWYSHVGNYSRSSIITVLEGPNYGLQTVITYYGTVLSVNYSYVLEYHPEGVILKHYYPDSTVVTGMDQAILVD